MRPRPAQHERRMGVGIMGRPIREHDPAGAALELLILIVYVLAICAGLSKCGDWLSSLGKPVPRDGGGNG